MEENAKVSGFHSIDVIRYDGFTERMLSDLEVIITNFYNLPKVQAMIQFYDDLSNHLFNSPGAHDIDITPWSPELIQQLYRTYRSSGFVGTKQDMLSSIAKFIEIGSMEDYIAGFSDKKAVNVLGWQYLFKKHSADKHAHKSIFEIIQPNAVLNREPGFYFSHLFGDQFQIFQTDGGYTITSWNQNSGTLYFDFLYDFTENSDTEAVTETLFTLAFVGFNLVVTYSYDAVNKAKLHFSIHKTTLVTPEIQDLYILKLPFDTKGYDRVVWSYDKNTIQIRDLLSSVSIPNPIKSSPFSLNLGIPLDNKGTALREISYYRIQSTEDEQLFFLN